MFTLLFGGKKGNVAAVNWMKSFTRGYTVTTATVKSTFMYLVDSKKGDVTIWQLMYTVGLFLVLIVHCFFVKETWKSPEGQSS